MDNQGLIISDELRRDSNTGLTLANTYESESGFMHHFGLRKFGELTIAEMVAQGTGVTYLSGVQVHDKEGKLIIDHPVNNGVKYSREKVRRIVLSELLGMLKEATINNGAEYNETKARNIIDERLKEAYYEESYKAVLEWAEAIGII